jgi:hypothetical protein
LPTQQRYVEERDDEEAPLYAGSRIGLGSYM